MDDENEAITLTSIKMAYPTIFPERMRKWVNENILNRLFQEIHIERINQTQTKLFKWIEKHPETMLMPTFSVEEEITSETLQLYKK